MGPEVLGGFLIGFLGSFHCVGMCGPIVLALPTGNSSNSMLILSRVLYNLGRIFTYSFFGAVFGFFGRGITFVGFQRFATIAIGISILLYYLLLSRFKGKLSSTFLYQLPSNFVKNSFKKLTKSGSPFELFIFGILNGFLPCGFVYVALAGAITTGNALSGAIFMALFGLGTTPIMLGTALVGKFISINVKRKMNKLIPVFAVVLAIIFILRGLNLNIKYISPKLSNDSLQNAEYCDPENHQPLKK
ncbi:MAG: sulfite exporter TauE/SafE family protein [Ignavibacteriales bacterium]|nr:sulfite exporter TauE/SafE family protein [Ignavibacteriales bacterium]